MTLWLDPQFWSRHFVTRFVPQVEAFLDAIERRVLPAFEEIDEEANSAANEEYERLGSMPGGDSYDMADAAEQALEAGITVYQRLFEVRQAILNVSAAALYHLLEQQLLLFYRRQVLRPSQEAKNDKLSIRDLIESLSSVGVQIRSLASWAIIEELRLLANAVKHAEGASSSRLRQLRPELFVHPSLTSSGFPVLEGHLTVDLPLGGLDIYVTPDDLSRYRGAITSFWTELGEAILKTLPNT